jgi:hypothetical protein
VVRLRLRTAASKGPIVHPQMIAYMRMESHGGIISPGKTELREKPRPIDALSTTNHIWTDPGSNPGLSGDWQNGS